MVDLEEVLLAGASGGTGRAVLRVLAPRSVSVRATTRSQSTADRLRRLGADEVVVGDLLDPGDAATAVEGVDAVLSTVGTSPLSVWTGGPYVDGRGNVNLVEAAAAADVEAFVVVSALGVGDEPASPLGRLFNAVVGPVQRAKGEAEAAIRAAPVRHTILRPGVLTRLSRSDEPQVAAPGAKLWGPVSRRTIGRLVAAAPVTPAAADSTFEVVSNRLVADRALSIDWQLPNDEEG